MALSALGVDGYGAERVWHLDIARGASLRVGEVLVLDSAGASAVGEAGVVAVVAGAVGVAHLG